MKCSCRFLYMLLFYSLIPLVLAATLIFLLSYNAVQNTVSNIQSTVRELVLDHARHDITGHLSRIHNYVASVEYSSKLRFPEFYKQLNARNQVGLFSDFSFMIQNVPYLSAVGIANSAGVLIRGGLGNSGDRTQPRLYIVSDNSTEFKGYYYNNAMGNTINGQSNTNIANHQSAIGDDRDFHPLDRVDILQPVAQSNLTHRAFFRNVINHYNSSIGASTVFDPVVWSAVTTLTGPLQGVQTIMAGRLIRYDNAINNTAAYSTIAFVQIYLSFIDELVSEIRVSPNSVLVLVEASGNLLGSSLSSITSQYRSSGVNSILQSDNSILRTLGPLLLETGHITSSSPVNSKAQPFNDVSINVEGRHQHLSAATLDIKGLYWSIIVITDDEDFSGDLTVTFQRLIGIAVAIIIVAAVSITVATRYISLPLVHIIALMTDITGVSTPGSPVVSSAANSTRVRNRKVHFAISDRFESFTSLLMTWKQSLAKSTNNRCFNLSVPEIQDLQLAVESMLDALAEMYRQMHDAHSSKQQFIRYIFHEVRVPFNSIVLAIDQLQLMLRSSGSSPNPATTSMLERADKPVPSPQTTPESALKSRHVHFSQKDSLAVLNILSHQSKVVSVILNDVLSLQKIEDGGLELDFSPICVECMLVRTLQSFQPDLKAKRLRLTLVIPSGSYLFQPNEKMILNHTHIWLLGDRYRLSQVVANYLSNAIKFTDSFGSITVQWSTSLCTNEDALHQCRLSVNDTGKGMLPDEAASLFRPYSQLKSGRSLGAKGTGLGLSICKSLIELHGGVVGVTSQLGAGSQFYFQLSLPSATAPAEHSLSNDSHSLEASSVPTPFTSTPIVHAALPENAPTEEFDQLDLGYQQSQAHLSANTNAHSTPILPNIVSSEFLSTQIRCSDEIADQQHLQQIIVNQFKPLEVALKSRSIKRILVMEDNAPSQKLMCMLLKSLKYECEGVDNGWLGLLKFINLHPDIASDLLKLVGTGAQDFTAVSQHLKSLAADGSVSVICPSPYDCILIDQNMPILDGLCTTRLLRQLGIVLPIIACTGCALEEDQAEFRLAGVDDLLTKPVQKKQLIACLKKRLHS